MANANILIKDAELRMKNYEVLSQLKIAAQDGVARVLAQLVAGALSSVSVGAHISASNSSSYNRRAPATVEEALEFSTA